MLRPGLASSRTSGVRSGARLLPGWSCNRALQQLSCRQWRHRRPTACALAPSLEQALDTEQLQALIRAADADNDGRLTVEEATALTLSLLQQRQQQQVFSTATVPQPAAPTAPKPPAVPGSWELHLMTHATNAWRGMPTPASNTTASNSTTATSKASVVGLMSALTAFLKIKLGNKHQNKVLLSDAVWTFAGSFTFMFILGIAALHVKSWPVVGTWHQQGLNLLIGSFGTLSVLLFARPEAEAVKVWNIIAGHLLSIAVVLAVIQVMGVSPMSRAVAMGLAIAGMLWTDSVHPPGGALVLLAVDTPAVQAMGPAFFLYPSLAFCAAILLPIAALTNWLKRNVRFDWTASTPLTGGSNALRPKLA